MASSFVLPQRQAFQEFLKFPAVLTDPMRPIVIGPKSLLTRYAVSTEKDAGLVGPYDALLAHAYPYPNRAASSIVNQTYTKLFIDNALLKYWDKAIGVNGTVLPVAGRSNQFRAANYSFKSNGVTFPRSSVFGDRDVQVGDVVDVRAFVGGLEYDKRTSVIGFVADAVASTVGLALGAATNPGVMVAGGVATKSAGAANQMYVSATNAASYDGSVTGDLTETYTVEVVQSSLGGNLTTARLKVVSASGNDNYYPLNNDGTQGVIPAAVGVLFTLTPRGFKLSFGVNVALPVDSGVSPTDLTVGQKWTIQVTQGWANGPATSGGTYVGTTNTTYVVTVLTGGLYTGSGAQGSQGSQGLVGPQSGPSTPTVLVTTTTGVDSSGPTVIPAAGVAVPVGTQGVTISFSGTGLAKNSRWTIVVTAQGQGPYKTLILQDNLQDAITTAVSPPDLAVKLYIRKNTQVTPQRTGSPPNMNWTADANLVYVNPGITAFDASWTSSGVQQPLPITEGALYVETRQWLQDACNIVGQLSSVAQIQTLFGIIHPDNPLAWGLNLAILNASGSDVNYGVICGDPAADQSWINFLDAIANLGNIYSLAPLTSSTGVAAAYSAHVTSQSEPEVGAFRTLFTSIQSKSTRPVITAATTTDATVPLCTVTADPTTGLNILVKVPTGNCDFVTNPNVNPLVFPLPQVGSSAAFPAVQAGDTFRFLYTTDGFGNTAWTEYVVGQVVNDDTLLLTAPVVGAPFSVPSHFEVWHTMTKNNVVDDVLQQATPLVSSRVRVVWPDLADGNPGYFVAAALAGATGGVVINQGLRNLELVGFVDMSQSMNYLTASNRLKLSQNGVWVVGQDSLGFNYSQSATSTDVSSINSREESVVRNADAVANYILTQVQPFVGVANVVDGTIIAIRGAVTSAFSFLKSTSATDRLGPPLISGTILELRPHTLLKDRVVVTLRLSLPYPLNAVSVTLQLVA